MSTASGWRRVRDQRGHRSALPRRSCTEVDTTKTLFRLPLSLSRSRSCVLPPKHFAEHLEARIASREIDFSSADDLAPEL